MKKVVVFGGGTGLSNLLEGMKQQPLDITVVVTIADNGGSTGKIRDYYNIPAPGDLRRAIVALTNDEEAKELMNFRFDEKIEHHTIGNLILAAFTEIKGDMSEAVNAYSRLLNVEHNILPISNESLTLCAIMEDDSVVYGESQISHSNLGIKEVFYEGAPKVNQQVIQAIKEADAVIFSSGSLYTSIIPNLVFIEMFNVLDRKDLKKIYIANLVAQNGETNDYSLSDHINAINHHLIQTEIDYVIANVNYEIEENIVNKYAHEKSSLVKVDHENIDCILIQDDYITIDEEGHLRHNVKKIGTDIYYLLNGGFDE